MTSFYRIRPGMGLILLLISAIASLTFFVWGLRTPPLEQVWQMQLELKLGSRKALSDDELRLLQDILVRYPTLVDNMLEDASSGFISAHIGGMVDTGYAYAIRRIPAASGILHVESPTGEQLLLVARTTTANYRGTVSTVPFSWTLPNEGPFPQLIEVRSNLDTDQQRARPMRVELRAMQ